LVWYKDETRKRGKTDVGVYGQSSRRRLNISPIKYVTVFDAEIYIFLFCAHEIHIDVRPEKYDIICFDIQAVLKALQATKKVPIATAVPKGVD
jgi:hypothetical protein